MSEQAALTIARLALEEIRDSEPPGSAGHDTAHAALDAISAELNP